MTSDGYPHTSCGTCECGKQMYTSKKFAKRFLRERYPGEGMHVYQCGNYWHIGHFKAANDRDTYRQWSSQGLQR